VVVGARYIPAVRETGAGNITGTEGGEKKRVNANLWKVLHSEIRKEK